MMRAKSPLWRLGLVASACVLALGGCLSSSDETPPDPVTPPPGTGHPDPVAVTAFAPGEVSADIRWADYGVPYITSDSLEGIAFGSGYAFARDNACILADQIVRFNSERSRYFGPDSVPGNGDSMNLISDFAYKTLDIRAIAENSLDQLSDESRALLQGYAAGYNQFISDRPSDVPLPCTAQSWVRPVDEVDMLIYAQGVALLPGAANFIQPIFIAVPPGEDFTPELASNADDHQSYTLDWTTLDLSTMQAVALPDPNPTEMGSNGWGIGRDITGDGGALLANPHFPHSGNQRFWQSGIEIPGELKVVGGSLSGFPGLINIGYNENVAWTHTFSTAQRFIVYQLELDPSDPTGMTYLVDGEPHQIEQRDVEVEVNVGGGTTLPFTKTVYTSSFGPMLVVPGSFEWGEDFQGQLSAFALHDANLPNLDILDHWLDLNRARDIDDVRASFARNTGIIFNNIMATDRHGDVFYTDGSSVPNLSAEALRVLREDPVLLATRLQAGFFLVPGNREVFRADGTVPFEQAPQLQRSDFVQNANDSYWLSNPDEPIVGDYLLYGRFNNQQSLRSRMSHLKLRELQSLDDIDLDVLEGALLSNRAYLGEAVIDDLIDLCSGQGTTPVATASGSIDISAGCQALTQWNGSMDTDSVGALVLREFAQQFSTDPQWEVAFDPADPVNTPHTLAQTSTTLVHLANAIATIQAAGLDVSAPLGDVQFVERSLPDGTASGTKLPWGGANNIEGGFNVFARQGSADGTLLPRHLYPTLPGSQLSTEAGGYHITYGSSWMFVMQFTDQGPQGRGILTYSQSSDIFSPHYLDQTQYYSEQPRLRPVLFTDEEIENATIEQRTVSKADSD